MPLRRRRQAMVLLVFLAGVALTLAVLDRHLAARVGATVELAAIDLGEAGGGGAHRFDLAGVEPDLCRGGPVRRGSGGRAVPTDERGEYPGVPKALVVTTPTEAIPPPQKGRRAVGVMTPPSSTPG